MVDIIEKIKNIGKKNMVNGTLDYDNFKEEIDPYLNKKCELFKFIEEHKTKITCSLTEKKCINLIDGYHKDCFHCYIWERIVVKGENINNKKEVE